MNSEILNRTFPVIGKDTVDKLQKSQFCIVGCGGTGALFAEMLIRTGAQKITLIDGDNVDKSNLNRVIGFLDRDVRKKKVAVLKKRLECIVPNLLTVKPIPTHLRERDEGDKSGQCARDCICDSDIVIIAADNNKTRIECEKLVNDCNCQMISMGVFVNNNHSGYECNWNSKTPEDKKDAEGYGVGSYCSIVIEATAVAFSMLLHHIKFPSSSKFTHYYKEYKDFVPYC